jgi:hypothetical protein
MDRVLVQLNRLLDHDGMFQAVKADLAKRYPQTLTVGRHSTPAEVILRILVIKHGVPTLLQIAQGRVDQCESTVALVRIHDAETSRAKRFCGWWRRHHLLLFRVERLVWTEKGGWRRRQMFATPIQLVVKG